MEHEGREIALIGFEKFSDAEHAQKTREMYSLRTVHEQILYSYMQSNMRAHRIKVAYSDGSIGDFVVPDDFMRNLSKIRDADWAT